MGDSDLGTYVFDSAAESTAKEAGHDIHLKDRVLVIERNTSYRLTFQEMHDLRAMHIKTLENQVKETARNEEAMADSQRQIKNWTDEIKKAAIDIPELAQHSGLEGVTEPVASPIQPEDLKKDDQGGESTPA